MYSGGHGLDITIHKSYDVRCKQSSSYCGGDMGEETGHIIHQSSLPISNCFLYPLVISSQG